MAKNLKEHVADGMIDVRKSLAEEMAAMFAKQSRGHSQVGAASEASQVENKQKPKKKTGGKQASARPQQLPATPPPATSNAPQVMTRVPSQPPPVPAPPTKQKDLPRVNPQRRACIKKAAQQTTPNAAMEALRMTTQKPAELSTPNAIPIPMLEADGWTIASSPKKTRAFRNVVVPKNENGSQPSFADIAKRFRDEKTQEDVRVGLAMLEQERAAALQARSRMQGQREPEQMARHGLKRVYISNFPRMPFGKVKRAMFQFHVRLLKIHNLSWIGTTLEVLLDAHYQRAFEMHMARLQFIVDGEFDPLSPASAPRGSQRRPRGDVVGQFLQRADGIVEGSTSDLARVYFDDWRQEVISKQHHNEVPLAVSGADQLAAIMAEDASDMEYDGEDHSDLE
ncbi:hypothetical protein DFS34DRAFT_655051 [Phlyctochytrium arcticum]|nr:hypothetical protein DFS34DRAFT_655051 [Phlyctochytrium arcticum]